VAAVDGRPSEDRNGRACRIAGVLRVGGTDGELIPGGVLEVFGSVHDDDHQPHPFTASESKAAASCEFAQVVGDLAKVPGGIRQRKRVFIWHVRHMHEMPDTG
jgi:hypothetical protein